MVYKSFSEIIKKCQENATKKNAAVVCAEDDHTLEAVMMAVDQDIIVPVLIGNKEKIEKLLEGYGEKAAKCRIIPVISGEEAVSTAIKMAHSGEIHAIMKGLIQTPDLMRAVVNKETGLRTDQMMSHIVFKEIPNYHKIIALTDVALVTYPDLEQKKQLIINAAKVLRDMGYEEPKIGVLAALDEVNPKMPETVDGAELKKMNRNGEITGCIVEGPISYDLAVSEEAVQIKGYKSPVAADADVLLVPNITAGNILIKSWEFTAGARGGGYIVGAKVPIVLTSRASSTYDKYYSLVMVSSLKI